MQSSKSLRICRCIARPSRASAAASVSPRSLARRCTLPPGCTLPPPGPAPRAGAGGRPRGAGGPALAGPGAAGSRASAVSGLHGIGVRLLLQHASPVPHAVGAPTHPGQRAKVAQPPERGRHRALAHVRLAGDRRIARVEPAGREVQEVENQRMQHLQARVADAPPPWCRAAGWRVCRSKSRARCQSRVAAFFGMGSKRIYAVVLPDHTGHAAGIGRGRGNKGMRRALLRLVPKGRVRLAQTPGKTLPVPAWGLVRSSASAGCSCCPDRSIPVFRHKGRHWRPFVRLGFGSPCESGLKSAARAAGYVC